MRSVHQAILECHYRRLGAVVDAQLEEQTADVIAHGPPQRGDGE